MGWKQSEQCDEPQCIDHARDVAQDRCGGARAQGISALHADIIGRGE